MDLQFLNELKKEDKELRREQNKRYREKYREILNDIPGRYIYTTFHNVIYIMHMFDIKTIS